MSCVDGSYLRASSGWRYSLADDTFQQLRHAREAAASAIRRFQSDLERSETTVPDVPTDIYGSQSSASNYRKGPNASLQQTASKVHARVGAEKACLSGRFEAAGLPIPSRLLDAVSLDDLAAIFEEWHERLATEELFSQELEQWPGAPPVRFASLRPSARLDSIRTPSQSSVDGGVDT